MLTGYIVIPKFVFFPQDNAEVLLWLMLWMLVYMQICLKRWKTLFHTCVWCPSFQGVQHPSSWVKFMWSHWPLVAAALACKEAGIQTGWVWWAAACCSWNAMGFVPSLASIPHHFSSQTVIHFLLEAGTHSLWVHPQSLWFFCLRNKFCLHAHQ